MRFRRSNDIGRRYYSIPTQTGYTGGRPYRSFGRTPIKYSLGRSPSRSPGQTRGTPYGRITTLQPYTSGDRNYIRIRQILPTTVQQHTIVENIERDAAEKRASDAISDLFSYRLLDKNNQYVSMSPPYFHDPAYRKIQKVNPKAGNNMRRKPVNGPAAFRVSKARRLGFN